ncbi:MAG: bifunctional DNA-formamidopyrimidine glycosylase/DNA-(apurinic or apyrimidinic site) lyase [Candidatus Zambryskibacteria bacterium]|nr:bifunctional DNA-formamidopyrimidine glycosylase/DNA-(apurinic or apyrimidinic site) lyase [Candidatus Zambryskibacteria bacterium]
MPELPEVQTTVDGINKTVRGRTIIGVTTTYKSPFYKGKDEIKDPEFFKKFSKRVIGQKILKAERRAKNILIHLSGGDTILAHMKMTGYFFYNPPLDAQFIRLVFDLDNGDKLALSDMRRFAKVTIMKTSELTHSKHLANIGPEPLDPSFQLKAFSLQLLKRPNGKIKQVLMDPSIIAGIGNIYSDEILWRTGIHPLSLVKSIPDKNLKLAFKAMKEVLKKGIDFGGDSMSDYRNIEGAKGRFQDHHRAYRKHKTLCTKKSCPGILDKVVIGARSAHFCPVHQKLYGQK